MPALIPGAAKDAQGLLDQGFEQLNRDEPDAAHTLFSQVLKIEPNNARAHVGRAIAVLARYGNMDQAAADISAAEPTMQSDPLFHLAQGLLHVRSSKQRDPQRAEGDFTQAIATCGDNASLCIAAYNERAQVRAWTLDNPQGALEDFKRVTEIDPDSHRQADAFSHLAGVYFESLGDLPAAIANSHKAYELNDWPGYLESAAQYAVRSKKYAQALDIYNQLITDQKGDPRLLAGRAFVEWRSGDAPTAQQSVERALQLDPKLLEARYVKGLLLIDARQAKEALAELAPISVETNHDALDRMSQPFLNPSLGREVFYDMARASEVAGDHGAALKTLDQSLRRKSDWPQPYILRAEIFKTQGNLAGARENYLKALDAVGDDKELQASIEKTLADLTK